MPFHLTGQPLTNKARLSTSLIAEIRREWARELAKDNLTPDEYVALPKWQRYLVCHGIRERDGLYPSRIAKRYGIAVPKVSELLYGKIYKGTG